MNPKTAIRKTLVIGAIILICAFAVFFLPDFLLNKVYRLKIEEAFSREHPEYSLAIGTMHYRLWENRINCDSLTLLAAHSTLTCLVEEPVLRRVKWVRLFLGGEPADYLASAEGECSAIVLALPTSQYEVRCGPLRLSVPDSTIRCEALECRPLVKDESFFAAGKYRRTRFRATVSLCEATGLSLPGLLRGTGYQATSLRLVDATLDVLIDKEKPVEPDKTIPPMPGELASSIQKPFRLDSLLVTGMSLTYGERFAAGSKPGLILFENTRIVGVGIGNGGGANDSAVFRAHGRFMQSGEVSLRLAVPAGSPDFSYSGSVNRLDVTDLNRFLEVAEHLRIKSGFLETATFAIRVTNGLATGHVRPVYRDLTIAKIDKTTRSDGGIPEQVSSFLLNLKLRGNNLPDKAGSVTIGNVRYVRKEGDPFFKFVWFALRSGVGDAVGF